MEDDARRTTFVVNALAAGGRTGRRWTALEPRMREIFPEAEVQFTRGVGDGIRIAREAVARGQELVVAVGGDGTLHEVMNGLMESASQDDEMESQQGILGVLPTGSASDFARGLGIPDDPEAALILLAQAKPRRIDLGWVEAVDEEGGPVGRYFLNAADFGIGAEVVARVAGCPKYLPGRPTYLWQTVRTLITYRNPTVELTVDGAKSYQRVFKSIVVANAPYFGGGMCIAPDAVPDDGSLDLVELGDLGRLEAIRRLGETFQGARIQHRDIHYSRCKKLQASSASCVRIEADGELLGQLPATFQVVPNALSMLLPDHA